jgi:hypothetical protein
MIDDQREWVRVRDRARKQIEMGEALHRRLRGYATRNDCVDAAHYLMQDGAAARQGSDPRWMLRRPGLAHLFPAALASAMGTT